MAASRWHSNMIDLFDWISENASSLLDILMPPLFPQIAQKDEKEQSRDKTPKEEVTTYPEILPILPLRGVVVYPQTAVPLTVGQPRSIKLVDEVVAGDKLVGLVAAVNPELETPGPTDLYRVGTIATVHRLLKAPDGTIRLLVQGMDRFRLGEFVEEEPYLKAKVHLLPELTEESLEVDALARNARDQFGQIAQLIPTLPEELISSVLSLEDPLQTVYTIANFQRIELADAQQLLEIDAVREKLRKLVSVLVRELEVLTLGQKIQNEAREEIEKVQREYFLREQMKAIQRELGEKDEQAVEAEEFRKKIEDAKMPEEADKQARRDGTLNAFTHRCGGIRGHAPIWTGWYHYPGLE
jgi:ATP-dependent Lon protease